jgi:hypothetical protein
MKVNRAQRPTPNICNERREIHICHSYFLLPTTFIHFFIINSISPFIIVTHELKRILTQEAERKFSLKSTLLKNRSSSCCVSNSNSDTLYSNFGSRQVKTQVFVTNNREYLCRPGSGSTNPVESWSNPTLKFVLTTAQSRLCARGCDLMLDVFFFFSF